MSPETRKIYSVADLIRETGIPVRYINELLSHHGDEIPCLLDGTRRRYTTETIPVLLQIWRGYRKGIKKSKEDSEWYDKALEEIEANRARLSEAAASLRSLKRKLLDSRPHRVYYINAFPGKQLEPTRAIAVHVVTHDASSRATLMDVGLEAFGTSDEAAVLNLREVILRTYLRLEKGRSNAEEEQFTILTSLIRRLKDEAVQR